MQLIHFTGIIRLIEKFSPFWFNLFYGNLNSILLRVIITIVSDQAITNLPAIPKEIWLMGDVLPDPLLKDHLGKSGFV